MWNFATFRNFAIWVLLPFIIILGPVAGNYVSASYDEGMIAGDACGGQPCPPMFSRWEDVLEFASASQIWVLVLLALYFAAVIMHLGGVAFAARRRWNRMSEAGHVEARAHTRADLLRLRPTLVILILIVGPLVLTSLYVLLARSLVDLSGCRIAFCSTLDGQVERWNNGRQVVYLAKVWLLIWALTFAVWLVARSWKRLAFAAAVACACIGAALAFGVPAPLMTAAAVFLYPSHALNDCGPQEGFCWENTDAVGGIGDAFDMLNLGSLYLWMEDLPLPVLEGPPPARQVSAAMSAESGFELHAISLGEGAGDIRVRVDRPDEEVVLLLSSGTPRHWDVEVSPGTTLRQVVLQGRAASRSSVSIPGLFDPVLRDPLVVDLPEDGGTAFFDRYVREMPLYFGVDRLSSLQGPGLDSEPTGLPEGGFVVDSDAAEINPVPLTVLRSRGPSPNRLSPYLAEALMRAEYEPEWSFDDDGLLRNYGPELTYPFPPEGPRGPLFVVLLDGMLFVVTRPTADLWSVDMATGAWRLVSEGVGSIGVGGAVYDPASGWILVSTRSKNGHLEIQLINPDIGRKPESERRAVRRLDVTALGGLVDQPAPDRTGWTPRPEANAEAEERGTGPWAAPAILAMEGSTVLLRSQNGRDAWLVDLGSGAVLDHL
jgi:hypothetical protein